MFGIKFNFLKKKKSDVIKKVLSEEEILAIKEHYKAIQAKNINLIKEHIDSFIKYKEGEFMSQNPKPFNVGDLVTYDYYDVKGLKSKNYTVSLDYAVKEFKEIKELKGTFTAPVHKIFIENNLFDKIYEKTIQEFDFSEPFEKPIKGIYNINKEVSTTLIDNLIRKHYNEILSSYQNNSRDLFRWFIDFDWEELKIPHNNEKGWLDLRWGGFSADCFLLKKSKIAKEQIKLWKIELKLKIQQEKLYKKAENQMNKLQIKKEELKISFKKHGI